MRWTTLDRLAQLLSLDVLPVIPAQGSVGASGDLAPLAHLAALLIGVGDARLEGATVPAAEALDRYGLAPLTLGPKEGLALLNGTQVSTALALAALFRDGARVPGGARHRRARDRRGEGLGRTLRRAHPGAARPCRPDARSPPRCARLLAGSAIRESHRVGDDRIQDPYCLRCQPQVMGACLDLLRQVGAHACRSRRTASPTTR